jgi:hypothetical protein
MRNPSKSRSSVGVVREDTHPRLTDISFYRSPYPHFTATLEASASLLNATLAWLETEAPWRLVRASFYEQYEFSLLDVTLPRSVQAFTSPQWLEILRDYVSTVFNCPMRSDVLALAHRLTTDQRIAIHNDYLIGEESHRLVIQLNRGLTESDGGFFMLFNSEDVTDISAVLAPVCGSVLSFAIGPNSYHAVSRMHRGERFTLIYSFYCEHGACAQDVG